MELIYNEKTGKWEEAPETYGTIECATEDDYEFCVQAIDFMRGEAKRRQKSGKRRLIYADTAHEMLLEGYEIDSVPTADVQPGNRWISVKDRLPEIGRSVLIYYPKWDGDEIQVAKLEGDGMMFDICGEFNIGVGAITHWMTLPELPKDGDTECQDTE